MTTKEEETIFAQAAEKVAENTEGAETTETTTAVKKKTNRRVRANKKTKEKKEEKKSKDEDAGDAEEETEAIDLDVGEATDAGSSLTVPVRAGEVKKGTHVLLKGKPCKVTDISVSKTGKHGHAKAAMVGLDIFTGRKLEDISPCSHTMQRPVISNEEYQVLDVEDGFLSLMHEKTGEITNDVKQPDEPMISEINGHLAEAKKGVLVTVMRSMNMEKVVSYKLVDN